jgi:cytochrome c556
MTRKIALKSILAVSLALTTGAAMAAGLTGAEAAKDRQVHFKEMGKAMKTISDQLKSAAPDQSLIKVQTALIADHAKVLPSWFPADSGPSTGVKMQALPVVWTDKANFADKAHNLQVAAAKLNAVAQAGNTSDFLPALKATGEACKSCHETFRQKDHD